MEKVAFYCLLILFVTNCRTVAQDASTAEVFSPDDIIVYKSIDGVDLNLHIFRPEGSKDSDKVAAIVFFFGGGWAGGTPKQFYQQASALAKKGMVAISAEYRVRSRNNTSPFESVKDARSAIRWVRKHAEKLGIDPNKIVASGGSAGGHIAACTGMDLGEDDDVDVTVSCIPNALILFNPVLDTSIARFAERFGEQRKTEVSPVHHVRTAIPPSIVFHGTADDVVPFENAERFQKLMTQAGNDCSLEPYEGKGHGFFNGSFFRPKAIDTKPYKDTMQKSIEFLLNHDFLIEPNE